jgi:hypothetical protein
MNACRCRFTGACQVLVLLVELVMHEGARSR